MCSAYVRGARRVRRGGVEIAAEGVPGPARWLSAWPAGTRLILRKERPHPGAQLSFTDPDGHRIIGFPPTPPTA